jgi:hypothetical protein
VTRSQRAIAALNTYTVSVGTNQRGISYWTVDRVWDRVTMFKSRYARQARIDCDRRNAYAVLAAIDDPDWQPPVPLPPPWLDPNWLKGSSVAQIRRQGAGQARDRDRPDARRTARADRAAVNAD